jgi:protein O-GlcNAc transferase
MNQTLSPTAVKFNSAILLYQQGRVDTAADLCREILQAEPGHSGALYLLGLAALRDRHLPEAIDFLHRSLALNPNQPTAHLNLGVALLHSAELEDALASFDRAAQLNPNYALAWSNRGNILRLLGRYEEALASCERALALNPSLAEALNNRGAVLLALKRPSEALADWERSLRLKPDLVDALNNCANTLVDLKRYEDATQRFEELLRIVPDYDYASGSLLYARLLNCDWRHYEEKARVAIKGVMEGRRVQLPFAFLGASDSPAAQLQCARTYMAHRCPPEKPLWRGERYEHRRIRVAYVSADFRDHPVTRLLAGVLERHDTRGFETYGVSLNPEEATPMGQRVKGAFEHFADVSRESDAHAAQLLRDWDVDIAVDLTGHTIGCRPGILARRPAPVQVNYLGFPGTMGAPYVDYILADDFVIPPAMRAHYAEQVVNLPGCFQANDNSHHRLDLAPPPRPNLGLPTDGLVFCCFNASHKLNPPWYDLWCGLLRDLQGSVLWLLAESPTTQNNLRAQARARGVSPDRLVFADRLPYEQHLVRLQQADLFLDTFPFNAGATASAALSAGVPVLTCVGQALAARMAGSLLRSLGLDELITYSADEYRQRALQLAHHPRELADLRARLVANRFTHSVFDPERFCRSLERAYLAMWRRSQQGEPPESFSVEPETRLSHPLGIIRA